MLSIITLGIYSAWAKVRTKKYFYGNTELAGDRFDYHATPVQILIGRIIAVVLLAAWVISQSLLPQVALIAALIFMLLLPVLARNNARFDSSMTSYRNVRFSFAGDLLGAYIAFVGRPLLLVAVVAGATFLAFGVSGAVGMVVSVLAFLIAAIVGYGWVIRGIMSYFANGYRYGEKAFSATLSTGFFVKTYLQAWLIGLAIGIALMVVGALFFSGLALTLISVASSGDPSSIFNSDLASGSTFALVIGLYLFALVCGIVVTSFVAVRTRNYVFGQMLTEGEDKYQLRSEITLGAFVWLTVSNFLAQLVTLGLARPWVLVRTSRYLASVTAVEGDMSLLRTADSGDQATSSIGDEVSQAFNLEVGLN